MILIQLLGLMISNCEAIQWGKLYSRPLPTKIFPVVHHGEKTYADPNPSKVPRQHDVVEQRQQPTAGEKISHCRRNPDLHQC